MKARLKLAVIEALIASSMKLPLSRLPPVKVLNPPSDSFSFLNRKSTDSKSVRS